MFLKTCYLTRIVARQSFHNGGYNSLVIHRLLGGSSGTVPEVAKRFTSTTAVEDDILLSKLETEVKGHDVAVINSYEKFVTAAAKELGVNLVKVEKPPRVTERMSLLKSVHVYKKHFVQYETRTNYRTFHFKNLTGSTANIFLEYIQRNLPEGVAMKTTRTQIVDLPENISKS